MNPLPKLQTKWSMGVLDNEQFLGPCGITVDGQGRILVTDTGRNCADVFTAEGASVATWGSAGRNDAVPGTK